MCFIFKSIVLSQCAKRSCHCGDCKLCKVWSHRPVHATSNGQVCTNSLLFKLCEALLRKKSWSRPSNNALATLKYSIFLDLNSLEGNSHAPRSSRHPPEMHMQISSKSLESCFCGFNMFQPDCKHIILTDLAQSCPETALSNTHLQDHEILWMPQGEAVVPCSIVWMPLPHQAHGLANTVSCYTSKHIPQWHNPLKILLPLRLMDQMMSEPKASSSISVMQRCSPSIKSTCHSILLQGVFIKR